MLEDIDKEVAEMSEAEEIVEIHRRLREISADEEKLKACEPWEISRLNERLRYLTSREFKRMQGIDPDQIGGIGQWSGFGLATPEEEEPDE